MSKNFISVTKTMSAIKHIDQFKQEIRCCRELAIPRLNDSYRHHVFVGRVDKKGCYLYHYESVSSGAEFPGQIRKVYLDFENTGRIPLIKFAIYLTSTVKTVLWCS